MLDRSVVTTDYRKTGLTKEAIAWVEHASIYHAPTPEAVIAHKAVAEGCKEFLATILESCPPCPDRTHALNHVRQARMWSNSAVALEE